MKFSTRLPHQYLAIFLDLFRNSKYFSENLTLKKKLLPWVQFHRPAFWAFSSGLTQFGTQLLIINVSYNVLEFISKFQIVFEKHAIFRFWTYIVMWMGKEYLSTFNSNQLIYIHRISIHIFFSLKAKKKAHLLSVLNFNSVNINLLCALFWWNQL